MLVIPDEVNIPIKAEKQKTVEWCALSSACALATFLGTDTQPSESDLANIISNRNDCFLKPTPAPCIVPATDVAINYIYNMIRIGRTGPVPPLPLEMLLTELIANRPVEIAWKWHNGDGHVAIIHGFKKDISMFYVTDPWFGDQQQTYQQLHQGYGIGWWSETYYQFLKL